ncbi:hypothetical protein JG687_00009136, partial [Phytophthora cactorum]
FLRFNFANRSPPEEPVLLLWDDFSGHWSAEVLLYAPSINVVLLKVPPHATSVCQPADVAWNHPLKARLRQCWLNDLQEQVWRPRKQRKEVQACASRAIRDMQLDSCELGGFEHRDHSQWVQEVQFAPRQRVPSCCVSNFRAAETLSIAENTSSAVDDDQDFDRIVEEAVV